MPKLRLMPKIECENEKQTASCRFNFTRDKPKAMLGAVRCRFKAQSVLYECDVAALPRLTMQLPSVLIPQGAEQESAMCRNWGGYSARG